MNEQDLLDKYNKIDTSMLINLTNLLYDPNVKITLEEIRDCFSKGQMASKLWLIDELNKLNFPERLKILILGGWIGSLASLMFQHYKNPLHIRRIVSVDIDPRCELIADYLNMEMMLEQWTFKAFTQDMYDLNYECPVFSDIHSEITFLYNTVINTSCEHIPLLPIWLGMIPHGKLVILQSNNFFEHEQHVNCVSSLEEFEEQCSLLNTILYKGTLSCQRYDRYMIIGYR